MVAATTRIQNPISSLFAPNFQRNPRPLTSHHRVCYSCKISLLNLNCTKPSDIKFFFACNSRKLIIKHRIYQNDNTFQEGKKPIEKKLVKIILEALIARIKPAAMFVFLGGLWLCLLYDPHLALAASGGRMGGGSFSSSRSSSSSTSSPSYSTSSSSSSLSRSHSYSSSESTHSFSPSYTSSIASSPASPPLKSKINNVQPFYHFLVFTCLFSFFISLLWAEHKERSGVSTPNGSWISILKLQVGLLGSAKSLQRDLNRIAETSDTSTPKGLKCMLDETIITLLRHSDYCIYGYSSADVKKSVDEAEARFRQFSIEERGKFDRETLVNFNNMKKKHSTIKCKNGVMHDFIVVTILVVVEGEAKLPTINTRSDLGKAMQKLVYILPSEIVAVEVLWSPQDENDILSEHDLLKNYQVLRLL